MLVAANKVDLVHARVVGEQAGRELARELGAPHIQTSAKEPPLNVERAFHEVRAGASWASELGVPRIHTSASLIPLLWIESRVSLHYYGVW